jgi:hypothetical protein
VKETVTTITCDGCGEPINPETSYEREYWLVLDNESKGWAGGATFAMGLQPVIGRRHDFHSLRCLFAWTEARVKATEAGQHER